ncbi:cupredoxin domain-containing protein [Mucilaginibacter psychrotolerans]|uniref:Cytochrome C oxidase subunit II n=1 Tax=Mucilaginibacter psychrotolerans TaxID=1524096 RepID=A0A4Y8SH23_9SPHI|nr:cytochrome C oxidase subunit II [Mucilaginibacter psychrotolerans]TFF37754.1 cytochrome C oxidase subunit II [Mucilaginibacter psychrotolerans]
MNKYEIRIIALTGAVLTIFLSALLFSSFSRNIDVPACIPYSKGFTKPHFRKLDDHNYEVYAVAHMWTFDPDGISIPKGSTVDLYLTSVDVVHGFNIMKKGVNLMAVPGGVSKTTIVFSEPGIYSVVCHEYCGAGHQYMMGKINVTD